MWMKAVQVPGVAIVALSVSLLIACGGSDTPPGATSNDVDGGMVPEQDAAPLPEPDSGFVPIGEPGILPADLAFDGVPTDVIPYGVAPEGCAKGLDESGRLALLLGQGVNAVHIGVVDDAVQANGVTCGAAATESTAAATRAIAITGGADDNLVIVDLSLGEFGASLLAASSPITIDLGGGSDLLAVIGTHTDDEIRIGSLNAENLLRFGDVGAQIRITNTESLIVSVGPGNDWVSAGGGAGLGDPAQIPVQLYGGEDDDSLQGGALDDKLSGGTGDDTFATAATSDGADTYDGGEGTDLMSYALRSAALSVTIGVGADDGEAGEGDDVQASVEDLIGGSGDDTITGSDADNVLTGGPGNDMLNGLAGEDTFIESAPVEGTDVINGGAGNDAIDYSGRVEAVHFTACTPAPVDCQAGACECGNDNGEADEHDIVAGVASAYGGAGNDLLIGNEADNWLFGAEGNDHISGGAGEDTLYGGDGDDVVEGGEGQGDICVVDESEVHTGCELGG